MYTMILYKIINRGTDIRCGLTPISNAFARAYYNCNKLAFHATGTSKVNLSITLIGGILL